ncbi:DEAD/SNF2-like helicase [Catovirus CTV1]|uniref:DEAD/SNF2-like helicase n=1 Tax=Catovirus CTV1 TaxID=1977631 RepID=A0A1V0SC09_9VIRU|nr:DEAD/SNF2-like helicase [Catovirus CTV1]
MSYRDQGKYVDLKINGRLFPSYILKNYKFYKVPEYLMNEKDDPCGRKMKLELRNYQIFVSKYLDYKSPHRDILLYHGLGSGKTASAINIYNMLYNYTPAWNCFVLLKATLLNSTWKKELDRFLSKDEFEFRMKNIVFISYDSPTADKQFLEAVKNSDSTKKSLYIIDEAHNFIRNVYSNINSKQGKRAQTIYDYMLQDKKENEGVRIVLLSGTPAINTPYEIALIYNLLRPGTFPKSEAVFNQIYVAPNGKSINPATKNMFQRRILGLTSYYLGATPDLFASKKIQYEDVKMSEYQEDIYSYFEEIEEVMAKRKKSKQGGSETYKSYTRQSSNFVFPAISQNVTGETRPRPGKFRLTEKEAEKITEGKGKLKLEKGSDKYLHVQQYIKTLETFVSEFDGYLADAKSQDDKSDHNIVTDFKNFVSKFNSNFNNFATDGIRKSKLFEAMYKCSAKMVNIIFNIMMSPGPTLVYSNYVLMEGLQIFKIYLKYIGFSRYDYNNPTDGTDQFRYMEYHGGIDAVERGKSLDIHNNPENKHGKIVKIMMISPAGAEGISLSNIRQVHIMEPYWNEVRIVQMIGRAVRQCSHKDLPMNERHVDIYRYKSVRGKGTKITTDQYIEELARTKQTLIDTFLNTLKEAAIDCGLNKNVNMLAEEYRCFQFDEPSLFDDEIAKAYADDVNDDMKLDNGLNSTKSQVVRIKVKKIKAVKQLTPEDENGKAEYSEPEYYWYYPDSLVVYDLELYFAVGKVGVDSDGLPKKLDKDTYVIDKLVPIPLIDERDRGK